MRRGASTSIVIGLMTLLPALAHETDTHLNLTARAFELLQQEDDRFACEEPAFDVLALLEQGVIDEDGAISAECGDGALCEVRFMQHYLPRLDQPAGSSSCSMLQWGFGGGPCFQDLNTAENPLINVHGWQAAVDAGGTEGGWRELGHLVHLLQDLTVPAHARNDAHPHAALDGDPLGAPDPLEQLTLDVDPLPDGGLVDMQRPEQLFYALQQYTQAGFFSPDTVFASLLDGPADAAIFARERYVDGSDDPEDGEPFEDEDYFYDGEGLRIAHKGTAYVDSADTEFDGDGNRLRELTLATVDDAVAGDQWTLLGPAGVRYAASLLSFYARQGGIVPCDITPPEITPVVDGTLGNDGWYVSDVIVSWIVDDPESGISSTTGCETTLLTGDTLGTTLTCEATNGVGLTSSASVTVKIDQSAPVVSGMPGEGCVLWPPNHKMRLVATVTANDSTSGLAAFDLSGTSNEPPGDNGPDIEIDEETGQIRLRAERLGGGSGRIYTLTAFAEDAAGNTSVIESVCTVPHDRGRPELPSRSRKTKLWE